jgi:hypothetical protein
MYGEPGNVVSQYYRPTPWYYPNTFHMVFCSLFPSVEVGNKVFHILCLALLPVSVFLVIKELGGNPWYGLLATLFTYNYNITFGFVGFAISIPVLLLLFYFILHDIRKDQIETKLFIGLTLVLLYFMHAQNALLGLLLYGLITLYAYRHSFKQVVARLSLVPVPLLCLIVFWWLTREGVEKEESTLQYLINYYSSSYLRTFPLRGRLVALDNFQLFEGTAGILTATVLFAGIILPLVWFRSWRFFKLEFLKKENVKYALLFFTTVFASYMLLPDGLPGQTPLFQRFCTIVIIALIILGSLTLTGVYSKALATFVLIASIGYSILWIEYLYSFNRLNSQFTSEFFSGIDNKATLAGLMYSNSYRGRRVYLHYPNYFLVWNNGIAASKHIDYRFGVVRRVASESELPVYHEYIGESYRPMAEYAQVDYLLVKGAAPVDADPNLRGFTLLREVPGWKLFVNGRLAMSEQIPD